MSKSMCLVYPYTHCIADSLKKKEKKKQLSTFKQFASFKTLCHHNFNNTVVHNVAWGCYVFV